MLPEKTQLGAAARAPISIKNKGTFSFARCPWDLINRSSGRPAHGARLLSSLLAGAVDQVLMFIIHTQLVVGQVAAQTHS